MTLAEVCQRLLPLADQRIMSVSVCTTHVICASLQSGNSGEHFILAACFNCCSLLCSFAERVMLVVQGDIVANSNGYTRHVQTSVFLMAMT
jgi:hypothetical protein